MKVGLGVGTDWGKVLPRTRTPNTSSFEVRERKFGNEDVQKGLYATTRIIEGELVVGMNLDKVKYIRSDEECKRVTDHLKKREQPMDAIVHTSFLRSIKGVYEVFDHKNPKATDTYWYYLNHSVTRANLRPCALKDKADRFMTVGFRAKRNIDVDEELLFNYGEPDLGWKD